MRVSLGLLGAFVVTRAIAAEPVTVTVWYRSAEGCPEASAFIERVRARVPGARLAQAGDNIDFVVTLGVGATASTGRLERQTKAGTVAIRELDGESCDQVADALALNVALALQPEPSDAASNAQARPELRAADESAAPEAPPSQLAEPSLAPRTSDTVDDRHKEGNADLVGSGRWLVGSEFIAAIGVASQPMAGVSLYLERDFSQILGGASLRVAPFAASSAAAIDGFRVWIAAGRLEACALGMPVDPFDFRACVAWDLGAIGAAGAGAQGVSDTGFWCALGGGARVRWLASEFWVVDADVGVFAPLTRYALVSESGATFHEIGPVGGSAAMGAGVRLP